MDLRIFKLSEVSRIKTNITWYCLYVESKKIPSTDEFIYKTEIDSQTENKLMDIKEEAEGGIN